MAGERQENIGIGCVKITEIIAYRKGNDGQMIGQAYFCKTKEEECIFSENNLGVEIETFSIELLASTARKYLDNPENKKQFTKQKETVSV